MNEKDLQFDSFHTLVSRKGKTYGTAILVNETDKEKTNILNRKKD